MVQIINGDILNAKENIIVQQVNCQGVMGAGLAKKIRYKWPKVYTQYKDFCKTKNTLLGSVNVVDVSETKEVKYIVNLFGQEFYGRDKVYTNYIAFEKGLKLIMYNANKNNLNIAIPYKIGCGLAGGNWDVIYALIVKNAKIYNVETNIYKFGV